MAAVDIESRNLGPGQQLNFSQSGGSGNTQYNAHTQNHYHTTIAASQHERSFSCAEALCSGLTRPGVDREALIYAKGKKVEGTCEWIEQDCEYAAFMRGDSRLLWICGGPGKGKTMISIYLTQLLERHQRVVYFFCQAGNEKRAAATYVLRSLLWQLVTKQPELCEHLGPDLDTQERRQVTLNSRDTLWLLFIRIIQDPRFEPVICLLDGLDECDEDSQHWLATRFAELNTASDPNQSQIPLRAIVVSRPGIPFLNKPRNIRLDPDNDQQVSRDIKTFVSTKVQMLSERLEPHSTTDNAATRKRLEDTLLLRAEGTFLWVGLAMVELLEKRTWSDVEDTLHDIPKGLPALYDRMLKSIEPKHHQACTSILVILTVAVRPFSMQELSDALDNQGAGGAISDLEVVRGQVAACGPLVHVSDDTVTLIHESARDYLLLSGSANERSLGPFRWASSWANLQLASACVACILRHGEARVQNVTLVPSIQGFNLESRLENSPEMDEFLIYSVKYWPEHARNSKEYGQQLLDVHPSFFGRNSKVRKAWWSVYSRRYMTGDVAIRWSLHIACALNFVPWARSLLLGRYIRSWSWTKTRRSNQRAGSGPTPLCIAASLGHVDVAKLLLENDARVDRKSCLRKGYALETPLHAACEWRKPLLVRLLLDYGASVETKRQYDDFTALHLAAKQGDRDTAHMLLARGAEVGARESTGSTPLHIVSDREEHGADILSLFVKHGANVNAADQSGRTPLHLAARRGNIAVARLLIDHDAETKALDEHSNTPLHSAAHSLGWSGHIQIMDLLLEHGAILDGENADGFTPLHMAIDLCNLPGFQLLLERGADFTSETRQGAIALHLAASKSFGTEQLGQQNVLDILLVLLERGADIHARDDCQKTPLHWALSVKDSPIRAESFESIVRILLQWGADANAQDIDGNSPLHLCVGIGLQEIDWWQRPRWDEPVLLSSVTRLLLESGADRLAKDKNSKTPFQLVEEQHDVIFAAHEKDETICEDLRTWYTLITPS